MAVESSPRRIEVTCPACGQSQTEPSIAVSTHCRACGSHFEIAGGRAVARRSISSVRVRKTPPDDEPTSEKPTSLAAALPWVHKQPGPVIPPASLIQRILHRQREPRAISCLSCQHHYNVSPEAQSSQCPKCGTYISLIDVTIDEPYQRRIETRGNVNIRKSGSVLSLPIRCHHLTVHGKVTSSIDCSGDLSFFQNAKILGVVKCRHLRVEKGVRIECLETIKCASATILGEVHGRILSDGVVTLEKKSLLIGDIRTTSLVIREGAKHQGKIDIVTKAATSR